jgi:hypothetical protein
MLMLTRDFRRRLVAAVFIFVPASAAAQGAPAALSGVVSDQSGGTIAGAVVAASDAGHPEIRVTSRTDAAGAYSLRALIPGTYELTVEAAGFAPATRPDVVLTAGQSAVLDVRLTVDRIAEHVQVGAPLLDVASATTVSVITARMLQSLPLARTIADLVNLAPGIHDGVALGGTERAVPTRLDGSPASEPGWGALFVNPNINWLEEVTIASSGAAADASDSSGARVDLRLRSGSSRLSGLGEYWLTPNWVGNNREGLPAALQVRYRPLEILDRWGATAQAGGPLTPGRIWFFGGVERLRDDTRAPGFNNGPRTTNEPFTSKTESRGLLKLTGALGRQLRPEAFYSYDSGTGRGLNAGPSVLPEAYISARTIERAWGTGLLWPVADTTVLEVHYGGHAVVTTNEPTPPSRQSGPPPHLDLATGVASVNAPFFNRMTSRPQTLSVSLGQDVAHRSGSHQLRIGIEYGNEQLTTENGYPGGGIYYDLSGLPVQLDVWDGSRYQPTQTRTSLYAQDAWRPTPRLTLTGGVRATINRGRVPGLGTVLANLPVAPRASVAWDVGPEHDTVIRGYVGRQHEPLYTSDYDFLDPSRESTERIFAINTDGTLTLQSEFLPNRSTAIDADIRQPRVDELSASIEHLFARGTTFRAEYTHRAFRDFIVTTDIGSSYTSKSAVDPGDDGVSGTADDGGPISVFSSIDPSARFLLLTNTPAAYRDYQAIRLIVTRAPSNDLAMQGSYTWSADRGSMGNGAGNRAGTADGGSAGAFVDPNRAINRLGPLPFDTPHQAKLIATYTLDRLRGVTIGGVARVQSGRPWERQIAVRGLKQSPVLLVRAEPRGTRRGAVESRLDLRVDAPIAMLPRHGRAAAYVDVYNVLNTGYATSVQPVSGPTLGTPRSWSLPRTVRFGVRTTF